MERTFQILNLIPAVGWQALACRIGKDGPITDSVPVVALAAVRYRYMDDSGKEYETEDRVEPVLRFDGDTCPNSKCKRNCSRASAASAVGLLKPTRRVKLQTQTIKG